MQGERLLLCWRNHNNSLVTILEELLGNNLFVDCTLAAEGQRLKAHKVILSACSPYFESLFSEDLDKHPIVILKDVKYQYLKMVIDFIYRGEVQVCENQLEFFLEIAKSLQIKGLDTNKPPERLYPESSMASTSKTQQTVVILNNDEDDCKIIGEIKKDDKDDVKDDKDDVGSNDLDPTCQKEQCPVAAVPPIPVVPSGVSVSCVSSSPSLPSTPLSHPTIQSTFSMAPGACQSHILGNFNTIIHTMPLSSRSPSLVPTPPLAASPASIDIPVFKLEMSEEQNHFQDVAGNENCSDEVHGTADQLVESSSVQHVSSHEQVDVSSEEPNQFENVADQQQMNVTGSRVNASSNEQAVEEPQHLDNVAEKEPIVEDANEASNLSLGEPSSIRLSIPSSISDSRNLEKLLLKKRPTVRLRRVAWDFSKKGYTTTLSSLWKSPDSSKDNSRTSLKEKSPRLPARGKGASRVTSDKSRASQVSPTHSTDSNSSTHETYAVESSHSTTNKQAHKELSESKKAPQKMVAVNPSMLTHPTTSSASTDGNRSSPDFSQNMLPLSTRDSVGLPALASNVSLPFVYSSDSPPQKRAKIVVRRRYDKSLACPQCGKHFMRLTELAIHMRRHTGERPYVCSECNRSFSQAIDLTRHCRVHESEQPDMCKTGDGVASLQNDALDE